MVEWSWNSGLSFPWARLSLQYLFLTLLHRCHCMTCHFTAVQHDQNSSVFWEDYYIKKKFLLGWQTSYPPIGSIEVVSWCAFHPKGKTRFTLLLYVLLSLRDQVEVCVHVQSCVSKDTERVWHRTYFSNWKLISGFFPQKTLWWL